MATQVLRKISVLFIVTLSLSLVTACGGDKTPSSAGSGQETSAGGGNCSGDGTLEENLGNISFPSECEVPAFPTTIKDYVLTKSVEAERIRIFEGDRWLPFLTEYRAGNSMSCEPEIWVVRWRTNNPDVQVRMSGTYGGFDVGDPTDLYGDPITNDDFNEETDWVAFYEPEEGEWTTGNAGYIAGPSCGQPIMQWDSNPAGNANLSDVYFEYQLWEYKPKI